MTATLYVLPMSYVWECNLRYCPWMDIDRSPEIDFYIAFKEVCLGTKSKAGSQLCEIRISC